MAISHRRMTLERFLQLPEEKPALEFENGRVEQKMSPKGRHSTLQDELSTLMRPAARRARARVFPELRFTFGGRSYVPDLSIVLTERVPLRPDGTVADEFHLAPDVAIEIRSPGQSLSRLIARCNWYIQNGVRIALLVDADEEAVFVSRPERPVEVVRGSERIELPEVLPGFSLAARRLFAALRLGR